MMLSYDMGAKHKRSRLNLGKVVSGLCRGLGLFELGEQSQLALPMK